LAVLTNFELPSVDLTLQHAGIDPAQFDALISSSSIGFYKPDPRAYLAAVEALGLQCGECAFVDDLPENVAAARELGMTAWLLDRERTGPPGDTGQLQDLYALLELLPGLRDPVRPGLIDATA